MIHQVMMKMIRYFGTDIRRINHSLKVYSFATAILENNNYFSNTYLISEKETLTIQISAILHDIGIIDAEKKYNSTAGKYQEIEGPAIAKSMLQDLYFELDVIDRVCFLVGNHHSYAKIDDIDFQILVEADFLVNIFEDNLDRDSIKSIKDKYFKTKSGIELINSMYLQVTD